MEEKWVICMPMTRKYLTTGVLLCATLFFGSGCEPTYTASAPVMPIRQISVVASQVGSWKQVADGISRREDTNILSSTASLVMYRFDAGRFALSFADATSTGHISDWRKANTSTVAILNGEYFQASGTPSGFLRAGGESVSSHYFDLDRSGFVYGGSSPEIAMVSSSDAMQSLVKQSTTTDILQSYPFLIKQGKAAVTSESGKAARRSFIGFDTSNTLYLGVIDTGDVTLHELSLYLAQSGVAWKDVLNLDGGPSTGLSVEAGDWNETIDSWTAIPNVVLVRRSS